MKAIGVLGIVLAGSAFGVAFGYYEGVRQSRDAAPHGERPDSQPPFVSSILSPDEGLKRENGALRSQNARLIDLLAEERRKTAMALQHPAESRPMATAEPEPAPESIERWTRDVRVLIGVPTWEEFYGSLRNKVVALEEEEFRESLTERVARELNLDRDRLVKLRLLLAREGRQFEDSLLIARGSRQALARATTAEPTPFRGACDDVWERVRRTNNPDYSATFSETEMALINRHLRSDAITTRRTKVAKDTFVEFFPGTTREPELR